MRKELGIFLLLVFLCIVTTLKNPLFMSRDNLHNMAQLVGMYGIFSIGMGIVIITGGIDLSVGSAFALLGVLLALMLGQWHWPQVGAAVFIIAMGFALGCLHGFLITKVGLQAFIVTLCGLLFYRGMARFITHDSTPPGLSSGDAFQGLRTLATGDIASIPYQFIILIIIAAIMWVVLHRSIYGRYLFAVGRNEEAARYSGINSRRIIASAYMLSGVLVGISAILLAFYTPSISPSSHGNFFELYAIAAAVLGGCSLRGGEGSIIGILIGTVLLQVLQNLVVLLGIPSELDFAVTGSVILIGVMADQLIKARSARKKPVLAT
ncbi:MAG: ABC transporter permease [Abitibacteriaceae bacterium]|nr:ABC transporter permease [Abditibacteriaceae bacterium]MBV9865499.1 ABC transporter permease [Abditibacteriaceae bacterium]